jgi:hypothetical protein
MADDDDRARKRQETREGLNALRLDPDVPERLRALLELFADRLDRLETGSFSTEERPTEPERRSVSSSHFKAVALELERGKRERDDGGG